ncbi:MAG: GNAT family N-acetyltransferase [Acholeplasmatales bacterium]|nr:GNAT family N-acetyltransferase [Acholeplasmatales bacterium]
MKDIIIEHKSFNELTNEELYEIIELRTKVFILEQKIYDCDELDYKDQDATHFLAKNSDSKVIGYMRVLNKGVYFKEHSFSRLAIRKEYRGYKLSLRLFKSASIFVDNDTRINAQAYLKDYYEKIGFETIRGPYLLEGILHYEMLLRKGSLNQIEVEDEKIK